MKHKPVLIEADMEMPEPEFWTPQVPAWVDRLPSRWARRIKKRAYEKAWDEYEEAMEDWREDPIRLVSMYVNPETTYIRKIEDGWDITVGVLDYDKRIVDTYFGVDPAKPVDTHEDPCKDEA